jgi:reverse gyrase
MYSNFKQYCTRCSNCGGNTSKHYARQHDGKCKLCATGIESPYRGPKCPDCGGPISRYQLAKGYHCDACTRQADPVGYYRETMGYND